MKKTVEELKLILSYEPDTGVFRWKCKPTGRINASLRAGCHDKDGYIQLRYCGQNYRTHRLAWLFMTGEWPSGMIDHKNGVKDDNRWENLREATPVQNNWNQKKRYNNASGHKNIMWDKRKKRWRVRIMIGNSKEISRLTRTIEDAVNVRDKLLIALRGEFARHA